MEHGSKDRFACLNEGKADFAAIYTAPDPRDYYRVLFGLDYIIPDLAKPVFRALADAVARKNGHPPKIVDLGCSYGVNGALLRLPLDLERLAKRYATPELHALDTKTLVRLDRHYFLGWPERTRCTIVGVDVSAPAVTYARDVGLVDYAVVADLEREALSPEDEAVLAETDLVISTGCVGYVSEASFERLVAAASAIRAPWVASFVLRMFDYDGIAAALERHGLVTEKLEGVTFVQRRFNSEDELSATLAALARRGIDPAGKEAEGLLHAELYVSRPPEDVVATPLGRLLSVTSGASRPFGRRFNVIEGGTVTLVR
jgi:hypothetical protein